MARYGHFQDAFPPPCPDCIQMAQAFVGLELDLGQRIERTGRLVAHYRHHGPAYIGSDEQVDSLEAAARRNGRPQSFEFTGDPEC
jgi:hypothetical protein